MSKKLLLADDSVTIQKVVELTFQEEDYDVSIVGNGLEALEKIKEERPDIILADISMPGLNGIDLCEKLKNNSNYKNIPIVLLINSFEEFDRKKGDKIGVDGYIEKPFESQDLIDIVQSLTEKKEMPEKKEEQSLKSSQDKKMAPFSMDKNRKSLLTNDDEPEQKLKNGSAEEELELELISEDESTEKQKTFSEKRKMSEENENRLKDEPNITEISREEISLKEIEEEPEIMQEKEEMSQAYAIDEEPKKEPEIEEISYEIKDTGLSEKTDLNKLDQLLGRYLRNLVEESFKKSFNQMTPKINEIIERLAKEMVPAIAESMIKKQIEKLKGGYNR
jgi:DNA-binding response OmpR family regulator